MTDTPTVRSLHNKAMEIAQDAYIDAQRGATTELLQARYRKALDYERTALALVPIGLVSEPTRSILCLSAGSLAMQAGLYDEAARVLNEGIGGSPSPRARSDLNNVLFHVRAK